MDFFHGVCPHTKLLVLISLGPGQSSSSAIVFFYYSQDKKVSCGIAVGRRSLALRYKRALVVITNDLVSANMKH